jgi:hypothetical protein
MLGIPQGWSLGRGLVFFFWAWTGRTISSPAVLVRARFTCRLASIVDTAGEARFQKPPQGFLYHLDFTYASSAGLLAYAPCILELSPQVGVSGGIPPSAPAAAPSGGGPGWRTAEHAGRYPLRR